MMKVKVNPRLLCGDPVQRTAKIRIHFKILGAGGHFGTLRELL
jgi:hypothetical protein